MTGIGTAPTSLTASLNLSGVNVVTDVSGQTVLTSISGNDIIITGTVATTTSVSGNRVTVSGNPVSISGNPVNISGNNVRTFGSSLQTGLMVTATSASGGAELGSGIVIGAKVRGLNANSGVIFLGGTGGNAPFSGAGLVLAPADPPIDLEVDNLNDIRVFASASGDRVSFAGIVS